jgi:hypothetical protein
MHMAASRGPPQCFVSSSNIGPLAMAFTHVAISGRPSAIASAATADWTEHTAEGGELMMLELVSLVELPYTVVKGNEHSVDFAN